KLTLKDERRNSAVALTGFEHFEMLKPFLPLLSERIPHCCATIKVRIRDNQGENGFSGLS
ncbi:MAG: hypothetical protein RL480_485, partial [Pseudomonadota bacterium]